MDFSGCRHGGEAVKSKRFEAPSGVESQVSTFREVEVLAMLDASAWEDQSPVNLPTPMPYIWIFGPSVWDRLSISM